MGRICPTCRQPLPDEMPLRVDLDNNVATANGVAAELSPTQAEILTVLVRRAPSCVSYERIIMSVWGGNEPGDARAVLHQHMTKMKRKVRPLGVTFKTMWGVGWAVSVAPPRSPAGGA